MGQWDLLAEALTDSWSGAFDAGPIRRVLTAGSAPAGRASRWAGQVQQTPGLRAAAAHGKRSQVAKTVQLGKTLQSRLGLPHDAGEVSRRGFLRKMGGAAAAGSGLGTGLGIEKEVQAKKNRPVPNMAYRQTPSMRPRTLRPASKLSYNINDIPYSLHHPTRDAAKREKRRA